MRLQDKEADDFSRVLLEDVFYRKEIILGFRHLLVMDRDEAIVEPVLGKTVVITDACL